MINSDSGRPASMISCLLDIFFLYPAKENLANPPRPTGIMMTVFLSYLCVQCDLDGINFFCWLVA